jgi:HEAT repeat protein
MDQLHSSPDGSHGPAERELSSEVEPGQIEELLRAFGAAVRNHRLYGGASPMLDRFLAPLRDRMRQLWEAVPGLRLTVEEHRFVWEERPVYPVGGDSGELPFLFFKDGIRELTLLPGLEDEVERLVAVVARAPQLRAEEDDLATVLWEQDLTALRYHAVEPIPDGVEVGTAAPADPRPVDGSAVREAAATPEPERQGLRPDDFQETLYFLDEAELRQLAEELRREQQRDLWEGVLTALYDRLEDGTPERQQRIMGLLGELLPSVLGGGKLERAAWMLEELALLAGRRGALPPPVLREARELFQQLGRPNTVEQLVQVLEDGAETVPREQLERLLRFFPAESIAPLLSTIESVTRPDVRRVLESAVERLAGENQDAVMQLLHSGDPAVVAGAARWVGRLRAGAAAGDLVRHLSHRDAAVRRAAVEALVQLRASVAGRQVLTLLEDPEREVRMAAVRALASLDYVAGRDALQAALASKRLRSADRTEKIAFFEAYGHLASADGVALLDRTLNGRSWLGRGESAEVRACAALALARVRHPSARTALSAAAEDPDPVVRTAVGRALRGEDP